MKVLITGHTGFLGKEIVKQLSLNPSINIQLLSNRLGDSVTYDSDIDYVINCASITSFRDSNQHYVVNAADTYHFAKRIQSQCHNLIKFIHIGTGYDYTQINDYCKSKSIGCKLLESLDLNLEIIKPSIIMGHSQTGCQDSTSIFWVIKESLKGFSYKLDDYFNCIPVDYCAMRIIERLEPIAESHNIYGYSESWKDIHQALDVQEYQHTKLLDQFDRRVKNAMFLYSRFLPYVNAQPSDLNIPKEYHLTSYIKKCNESTSHLSTIEMMKSDL